MRARLEISVALNADTGKQLVLGDGYIVLEGSDELLCQAIGQTLTYDKDLRKVWLHAMAHGDTDALIRELKDGIITANEDHKVVN